MRKIRIYQSGIYQNGQLLELTPEAGQHVAVVLRMNVGEKITLFCGDNKEYTAVIVGVKKKQVQVCIEAVDEVNRESPLRLHLAQALSKGDRMDLVMQKSVELGVASITPVITERCAVKMDKERIAKKIYQWQAIVIAACEQSGRNQVPIVQQPVSFEQYVKEIQAELKFIIHPDGTNTWRTNSGNPAEIALIVGPEGGFSDEEIKLACHFNFAPLSLGPRILRTETAAITALSVLQAVHGDL